MERLGREGASSELPFEVARIIDEATQKSNGFDENGRRKSLPLGVQIIPIQRADSQFVR
jgi:hypothetical protein